MNRSVFALIFSLVLSVALSAEAVVGYVDGVLEVDDGGAWYELYIGDAVDDGDTIRLAEDSYAELASGSTTVKLSRAGIYEVSDLIESTGRTQTAGLAGMVLGRIGRLSGSDEEQTQTVAGGARASEAATQSGPTWAGGEAIGDLIDEGVVLLNEGDYEDAYYVFEEAFDYAISDEEYAMAAFYFGYSSSLVGQPVQAFDLLEEVGPDPDTDYYPSHVLALGQLLVESFAYDEAIEYLEPLADDITREPADVQSAELLLGLAYDGMGMTGLAREYLGRASRTVPGTPAASAARRLLGDM
jgi:tetratricopeptide (TPR) repeat protein